MNKTPKTIHGKAVQVQQDILSKSSKMNMKTVQEVSGMGSETNNPILLESTLKDNHPKLYHPDRATIPGEKGREKVWEKVVTINSSSMPFPHTFKEKLACYIFIVTLFFLSHSLENIERPSEKDLIILCKVYYSDCFHRNITRILMCM